MIDLTDFGLEAEQPDADQGEPEEESSPSRTYRSGRCPAINTGSRTRCQSPVSRMNAADGFCGVHGREMNPWTIHDDPETLILLTGRLDALELSELEPGDVDFDLGLIREAVTAVQEAEA